MNFIRVIFDRCTATLLANKSARYIDSEFVNSVLHMAVVMRIRCNASYDRLQFWTTVIGSTIRIGSSRSSSEVAKALLLWVIP